MPDDPIPDDDAVKPIVDGDVTYRPWVGLDGEIGYRATHADGRTRLIYLNPAVNDDGTDAHVFVYIGQNGDPAQDDAVHHYDIWDD